MRAIQLSPFFQIKHRISYGESIQLRTLVSICMSRGRTVCVRMNIFSHSKFLVVLVYNVTVRNFHFEVTSADIRAGRTSMILAFAAQYQHDTCICRTYSILELHNVAINQEPVFFGKLDDYSMSLCMAPCMGPNNHNRVPGIATP